MIDIIDIIARILMLAHAFDWKSISPIDIDSLTGMLGERGVKYINIGFKVLYIISTIWVLSYGIVKLVKNDKDEDIEEFECDCAL